MSMVQAVSYNFSTVENPLSDGGKFTIVADTNFTGSIKTIAGNLCEAVTITTAELAFYSGAIAAPSNTWPADQYTEITLTKWSVANSFVFLAVRQGTFNSGTQYEAYLDFTHQQWALNAVVSGTVHALVAPASQTSAQGDVFRLTVLGSVITLSRNGSVVQTFTDTNHYVTSGSPGFGFIAATSVADVQTSLWAAGANLAVAPTFSLNGGSFGNPQSVTISSTSSNAGTIYYTTDGSTPTHASSSIANGASISVNANAPIKALASLPDFLDSAVAIDSGSYTNSVVDLFQRTAANLGANWTNALNGFAASNKAAGTSSSSSAFNLAYYSGMAFTSNQSSTIVVGAIDGTANSNLGAAVRIQQGTSGAGFFSWYVALFTNAELFIYKIVNATASTAGTATPLFSVLQTVSAGDIITLTAIGNTLTLTYNNRNTLYQFVDSSSPLTGGSPGIHQELNVASIAQWTGVSEAVLGGSTASLVCDGDSIDAGFGLVTPWESSLALAPGLWSIANIGVPKQTLTTCASQAAASVDALYNRTLRNVCFIWAGGNDMDPAGLDLTPAQVYAILQSYVAARQAVGWTVVVSPMLSNINIDAQVQVFNALLAAHPLGNAVVVLPATLTGLGSYSNTTYFQSDGIHPSQFSATTIIAPAISIAVNSTPIGSGSAAGTGRNVVSAGARFATEINSPRTAIIGTGLGTRVI